MYLDTHERDEMQKLVMSFHIRWFLYTMDQISNAQAWRTLVLVVVYFAGLATVVWGLPADKPGWLIWVLCGVFIGLLQLSYRWYRKTVKERIDENALEKWYQEIEQLDVESEERQVFLRLLAAMRSGIKEEVEGLLEESLRSSTLSRLSFLRELRAYVQ